MGENDRADFAARAARPARARHGEVCRLLRRGPRRLRRARPRGAREHLQHQRRQLPLPEHPAGLLAVHHLDARAGLGDVRLRRAARVLRHPARRSEETIAIMEKAARATCDFYIDHGTAADGIPYWDTGAPLLARWATGNRAAPSRTTPSSRWTARAAAIAAQGLLRLGHYLKDKTLLAGRADGARYALRRAVSQHRSRTPRPDSALRLPPPQRLGLHPARPAKSRAANRACGATTTPAKSRSTCSASNEQRTLSHFLGKSHDHCRPQQNRRPPYPARRRTQNLVGGASPIQATNSPWATSRSSPTADRCPGTTRSRKRSTSSSKAPAKCAWARSA